MEKKLVNVILKTNINITLKDLEEKSLFYEKEKSRDWCPFCNEENTFIHQNVWRNCSLDREDIAIIISKTKNWKNVLKSKEKTWYEIPKKLIKIHKAECAYNDQHIIYYAYSIDKEGKVFKFAEWPYDLIRKKMPLINKKIVKEIGIDKFLEKAYKSFQENLCLGAYFYLRRVVEEIVKHIEKNKKVLEDENSFKYLGQRIENIKNFLPKYIKGKIKNFTKILNNSIHNWNEEKAKENYGIIISFIEFLIDDLERQKKEKEDERMLNKKLNSLVNNEKKQ